MTTDFERDPFKTLILGMCFLYSPAALIWFNAVGGGTLHSFPRPYGHMFLVVLCVTSGMSLYGIVRQYSVTGLLWERAGLYGLAPLFLTYGVWALGAYGATATGFASLLVSLGWAAMVRIQQINRRTRRAVGRGDT